MSRAAGETEEVALAVEQDCTVFEEIDKLTELAIGATDVKKFVNRCLADEWCIPQALVTGNG
jgi:hypothetical protein